jgi:hypothetical protein
MKRLLRPLPRQGVNSEQMGSPTAMDLCKSRLAHPGGSGIKLASLLLEFGRIALLVPRHLEELLEIIPQRLWLLQRGKVASLWGSATYRKTTLQTHPLMPLRPGQIQPALGPFR